MGKFYSDPTLPKSQSSQPSPSSKDAHATSKNEEEKLAPPLQVQLGTGESQFVSEGGAAERICITGGASQNLACVLQVYSDPVRTKVWMVAPCYFLACRIFEDAGLRLGAVPEKGEGIDLKWLERELRGDGKGEERKVCYFLIVRCFSCLFVFGFLVLA